MEPYITGGGVVKTRQLVMTIDDLKEYVGKLKKDLATVTQDLENTKVQKASDLKKAKKVLIKGRSNMKAAEKACRKAKDAVSLAYNASKYSKKVYKTPRGDIVRGPDKEARRAAYEAYKKAKVDKKN